MISDFCNLWNDLYTDNEPILNKSEMPLMQTVYPALSLISPPQYDMLNLEGKDGYYTVNLLSGHQAFVEKDGLNFLFGYEHIRKKTAESRKAGDKLVENGNCELADGHMYVETYTERDGTIIKRDVTEFQKMKDGSMIYINRAGQLYNSRGDEDKQSTLLFIRNGKKQYDLVSCVGSEGVDFDYTLLAEYGDLDMEKALEIFTDLGYTPDYTASIIDDEFVITKH